MVSPRPALWVLSLSSFLACGGAETPKAAAPASEAPPAAEAGAQAAASSASDAPAAPATDAPAEKPTEAAAPAEDRKAAGQEAPEGESGRNVKYIVNPEGMRIEVDGVTFTPKAEAVKSGGGWAIKLKVEARAKDGNVHSLLAPVGTEVAIAGLVRRSGQAEPEMLSDHRDGEKEILLKDKAVTLSRTWPGPGGAKVLAAGDEAELLVGIWGLGENAASRRPVRKLCKLTVKLDKPKPRVSLGAPDGVSK